MMAALDRMLVGWASDGRLEDPALRATAGWPLAKLSDALAVAATYLLGVLVLTVLTKSFGGPPKKTEKGLSVMEKFRAEPVLMLQAIYNPVQVILCVYMMFGAVSTHSSRKFSMLCNEFDITKTDLAGILWVFYLSKVLDFLDTFFMIVRKKWRQLSFLHLYHHTSIFLIYWLNLNAGYDGDIYYTIVLNSFIHAVMYFYYSLTTFNVSVPKPIKRMVTQSQMIQFVAMNLQAGYLLWNHCAYPRNLTWLYLFYIISMLVLFNNFSSKTYKAKTNKTTASAPKSASEVQEVLINGKLYDVTGFKHPGGSIIKFLANHGDASDAFNAFHTRSTRARALMATLPVREPSAAELSVRQANGRTALAKDFIALRSQLSQEGFFKPSVPEIVWRLSELVVMHAVGAFLISGAMGVRFSLPAWVPAPTAGIVGVVVLGMASGRCGWLMHEAGHYSFTGHITIDRCLQAVIYGVGCGMSGSWWRSQHNKHHATPQKLKHDVDLDTLPLVAFHNAVLPATLLASKSTSVKLLRAWLRLQGILFIPLSCLLVATGWQLYLHPNHIWRSLTSKRGPAGGAPARVNALLELLSFPVRYYAFACVLCYGLTWGQTLALYTAYNWIGSMYIFTNFSLSHTHLPVSDASSFLHWTEYAAIHTTNIAPSALCNWWMCFLNFQIEHHLFPSMPQFRHPKVSPRVRALFSKHGLHYDERGYFRCLQQTLSNLHQVGASTSAPQKKID